MKQALKTSILFLCVMSMSSCSSKKTKKDHFYYEQTLSFIEQGNLHQAVSSLNKAIALQPLAHYRALKGTLLYQLHDFEGSKQIFKKLIKQKDISPILKAEIINNYACVINQLGHADEAEGLWQQLLKNPYYMTKEVAWLNLGMNALVDSRLLKKHHKKQATNAAKTAIHRFNKAIEKSPEYVDAYFFKAQAYKELNDKVQASKTLKTVVKLAPEHDEAQALLAKLT